MAQRTTERSALPWFLGSRWSSLSWKTFPGTNVQENHQHGFTKGKGHRGDKGLKYPSCVSLKELELNKRHVGIPSMCARLWKKGAKRTEPGSFQCFSMNTRTRQWLQTDLWDTPSKYGKTFFVCEGDWALAPDVQEGYGIFILWDTQKPLGHVSVQPA